MKLENHKTENHIPKKTRKIDVVHFESIALLVGECVRVLSSGIQKRVSMRFRLQRVFS